jgi:hypothetical protein
MLSDQYIHRRNELNRLARAFLKDQLASGPQPLSLIREQAAKQGISLSTLLDAKRSLRINARTIDKRSVWSLPKTT